MNETTIGTRLAQCRKEQGLSQEGLGEKMGVSRQAIYKWESDQSLPEIDKLIAMSKLFSVSVGWILGVEDTQQNAPLESGELTEVQLAMVEEIVGRYIAAQPTQPEPKKHRRWLYGVAACAVVLVGFNLFSRLDQMNNQYNNLQNSVHNINNNVSSQINSITWRVEEALKSQNNLLADYSAEYIARDLRANTATFDLRATPKTYVEGMEAIFVADNGSNPVEVPGTLGAGQAFSAEITCDLTNDISFSVVFVSGGQRDIQVLEYYADLYDMSLPEVNIRFDTVLEGLPQWREKDGADYFLRVSRNGNGNYVAIPSVADSSMFMHQDVDTELKGQAPVESVQVGVFKNQKLMGWAEECDRPNGYYGDYPDWQFYQLPEVNILIEEGDQICVAAVVTDIYGRLFVFVGNLYQVDEEGLLKTAPLEGDAWGLAAASAEGWDLLAP